MTVLSLLVDVHIRQPQAYLFPTALYRAGRLVGLVWDGRLVAADVRHHLWTPPECWQSIQDNYTRDEWDFFKSTYRVPSPCEGPRPRAPSAGPDLRLRERRQHLGRLGVIG